MLTAFVDHLVLILIILLCLLLSLKAWVSIVISMIWRPRGSDGSKDRMALATYYIAISIILFKIICVDLRVTACGLIPLGRTGRLWSPLRL